MAEFDLEHLMAPVSEEAPTGEDLEYDPEFMELERAATPQAERSMGDAVKAAEEPDWSQVIDMAQAVMERSKDLRAAVHLTTAWTRTSGMTGWQAGLNLIHGLLENYWDGVHPQLDAEDDDDPTARVNAVAEIANPVGVLGMFRRTHFVQSPLVGRFSLRDLRIANGTLTVDASDEEGALPSLTDIEACCMDCDETELMDTLAAVTASADVARNIDALFTDKVGTLGPELKPLIDDLGELGKFIQGMAERRNPELADGEAGESGESEAAGSGGGSGRIESPQDVIRRIDEICDYYTRREPSSPVPLLLQRAKRLVGLGFADLMQDLAPGGMSELKVISGASDEEEY